jgi:hypothetical protein
MTMRSKAVRKLDDALSPHYVRQEEVDRALRDLIRVLGDRFDAEAEAIAVLGQRLTVLTGLVEQLQEEIAELRTARP